MPTGADATVGLDDRWGEIVEADLTGALDVSACERLEIRGSVLRGVTVVGDGTLALDVARTSFVDCDLSAVKLATVTDSEFTGCKLSGIDGGSAVVRDVVWAECAMRVSAFRLAQFERVELRGCEIHDLDLAEATLVHVAVPGSRLREVRLDQARFDHVDLRARWPWTYSA
ncbi:MAG: pentapeptide repeat-containing protein [Acidimicrobiales bacterium]